MKTMTAFVSYSDSFNKVIARFRADPLTESDAAKASHRWTVLNKFEINFNHHTNVSVRDRCCVPWVFGNAGIGWTNGCWMPRVLGSRLHLNRGSPIKASRRRTTAGGVLSTNVDVLSTSS